MKKFISITALLLCAALFPRLAQAQCQFLSPTVELTSQQTDINGNCVLVFNLGFEIDINNGNKIIFVHLWRSQDYSPHTYSNQGQPLESNILNDALATIIIDNDVVNNNPSAPANQVFLSTYGPDPGIDDNTPPAIGQVKDATDGLTYNRVVVNAAQDIFRYTINNLTLVVPGGCSSQLNFTGDAWSSNANSSSPPVQCSMTGFTFLANDPTINSTFNCLPLGTSNTYSYTVNTTSTNLLSFNTDVYVDNGDDFFDATLDTKVVSNAGPYTATAGTPYSSGVQTYPAPYSTTLPRKLDDLWVVVKNMTLTNNSGPSPVVTTVSNSLIERVVNLCSIGILPVTLIDFTGKREGDQVRINWKVIQTPDITGYTLQRKSATGDWQDVAYVKAQRAVQTELNYQAIDKNYSTDMTFYRLRIENEEGKSDYSRHVLVSGAKSDFSYSIGPNPSSNGAFKVNLALGQNGATIFLYDLSGRQLQSMRAENTGIYEFSDLQPNTYLVKIAGDNASFNVWNKVIIISR